MPGIIAMPALQSEPSTESSSPGPLFVVGIWRSGTSLFYALLNQHPQIALWYESDLPLLWPLFLGRKAKRDWRERWQFWNSAPARHGMHCSDLPQDVPTERKACEIAWKHYAGPAVYGCKSPNYFDMLPGLAKQFPDAKFIVIHRNPLDVCRSIARASKEDSFFSKPGMAVRALRGCHELKSGVESLVAEGVRVHQVQYETLLEDPLGVMTSVCEFLGLPFDARMTNLQDADRSAIYDAAHHELVKSNRIGGRREEREVLSPSLLKKINRYIAFWHKKSGGQWPAVPQSSGVQSGSWFAMERLWDSIRYRCLRIADSIIVFVYCFAPLFLLQKYRLLRGRGEPVPVRGENLVGASGKN
jgi:Sulfotransferase family